MGVCGIRDPGSGARDLDRDWPRVTSTLDPLALISKVCSPSQAAQLNHRMLLGASATAVLLGVAQLMMRAARH